MLAIVALAGLSLCAALLGAAAFLGGDDIFHDPRSMKGLKPLIDLATRKEWRWAGGDTLALDAPMTLRYQPQGKPTVTVTGPADAVDHVRFGAGRITSSAPVPRRQAAGLQAVVSGVPIRKFVVNGGERLELGHIDQDDLAIHINGNGKVSGDGRVRDLTLVLNGPGRADLGGLSVGDATVSVLGPGWVTLAPHGDLKLFVAGNAHIALLTRPESLTRRIVGQAIIETPDGTERAPPPPAAREATPQASATPATPATPAMPPGAMPVPVPAPVPLVIPPAAGGSSGDTSGVRSRDRDHVTVTRARSVDLGHIDQDDLTISLPGSGSVTAQGRVDTLTVHVMGSGNANLGRLTARHVTVHIAGGGNVTVAPTEDVEVHIAGSGNVRLATKPDRIERHIRGSGRIVEAP
jgi:hypothetical protein